MVDWGRKIEEAITCYDPIRAFRHGRFLAEPAYAFSDEEAITTLLTHAARSGLLEANMRTRTDPNFVLPTSEWGWDAWNRWRSAQSTNVRGALAPLMPEELTTKLL
jgi:hypothetical protein